MNSFINIEPKLISFEGSKIRITVLSLELNQRAIIKVELFTQEDKIIETNYFTLENEEYQSWQSDDYLINYVCEKYGYVAFENVPLG